MSFIPYLGQTDDTKKWTDSEIRSFAIWTYLLIALFLIATGIALHNFVKLVARGDECGLTSPLFVFYILTLLALISNIVYGILIVRNFDTWMPFVDQSVPTFRILSGVEQIWMMIELTLQVNVEIDSYRTKNNFNTERINFERISLWIKRGRIVILLFILIFIVGMTIVCAIFKVRSDASNDEKHITMSFI